MEIKHDFIGRLTDIRDEITRAIEYLESSELAMAWLVLQNQNELDPFRDVLAELEKAVPDWQMRGFRSQEAYLDFQRQNATA